MQIYQEKKIAGFQIEGKRIQLLKITTEIKEFKYEIRINRKIETKCSWEGEAKRRMASIITNELLQQKFTF